jgi:hypothetical protein
MGLFRLAADKVAWILAVSRDQPNKWQTVSWTSWYAHRVLRVYGKGLVGRALQKFSTSFTWRPAFHRLRQLGIKKKLDNLEAVRQKLISATDRFVGREARIIKYPQGRHSI